MAAVFKPKIIGLVCNWCCYAGADLCGVSRYQYPPYIRLIRIMCSGRVDLRFVLEPFLYGADGVFVGGCWPGDCHYITHGNYHALNTIILTKRLLEICKIDSRRLRIEWVSAGEGLRFAEIMTEFGSTIQQLGPLGSKEGLEEQEIKNKLSLLIGLIPYLKVALREKLSKKHSQDADERRYSDYFLREEVEKFLKGVPVYRIDPDKCRSCGICARRCPAKAISGEKKKPYVIDEEKCIRCGTCAQVCPSKFEAVYEEQADILAQILEGEGAGHPAGFKPVGLA